MARPRNRTTTNSASTDYINLINLVSSDEDGDPAPKRRPPTPVKSVPNPLTQTSNDAVPILDLTGDSPQPENQSLKPASPQPEPKLPGRATRSSPAKSKPSSSRSTPVQSHVMSQPPSTTRTRNGSPPGTDLYERFTALPLDRGSDDEGNEEDDEDMPSLASLDSPSKRQRGRPSSQKSFDRSTETDSPLAVRTREKRVRMKDSIRPDVSPRDVMTRRSLSTEQQSRQIDLGDLEDALHRFEQEVRDGQAETTRWLLHDAKRLVEDKNPVSTDQVSPFASMQPANIVPGEPLPPGFTKIKMDTYGNKKKLAKTRIQLVTTKISSDAPRVPRYTAHTIVKRNVLCGDDEQLKFIPFLADFAGESNKNSYHRKLVKELDEAYTSKRSGSAKDIEWATKLRGYLPGWLRELDLGFDRRSLEQYLLEEDSDDLHQSAKELRILRNSFCEPLAVESLGILVTFSTAFTNVFGVPLKDVLLPKERLKEMLEKAQKSSSSLGRSQSDSPQSRTNDHTDERLGTFTNLTCLICGAVCCQTHGDYNSLRVRANDEFEMTDEETPQDEYEYTHQPLGMHYHEIIRKQKNRLAMKVTDADLDTPTTAQKPCSDLCYRTFDYQGETGEWTQENIAAVKSFVVSMRPKGAQPCNISFLLDLPCWQIHCKMEEYRKVEPEVLPRQSPLRRSKAIDWYDNKRKVLRGDWQELTTAHLHQERIQANPCSHEGPCQAGCPCSEANILCETFCVCSDCPRKFTGCSCHASGISCVSESCICIAMNRECGPQCVSCGAVTRINPKYKYDDELFTTGCQNIVLQRAVDRKLMIGESQLEGVGFGLYLGEPVRKGEYLSEYAGEVISFAEADRRGIVYDRKYLSFLFDLNSEWCIDAARLGNKTRFINHADNEKDGLNCEAKIFLVNGEHRIKFVALRDIAAGEELLFNYGKKFAEKHGLSKKLPKAKEGGKKGVVVGEEALDALDGNRTRGRMTAIRGGHGGGRGGRKARKTAPTKRDLDLVEKVVKAVDKDVAMDDVFEEEGEDEDEDIDVEEDDVRRGRKKRKTHKPKRYAR